VRKLEDLTKSGKLEWEKGGETSRYRRFDRDRVVGTPFFTDYEGKHIALYEIRFPTYDEDDNPYTRYATVIEFVEPSGQVSFTWPISEEADDLLETVRFQQSGASEFLDKIVGPDPTKK
jgi:hypothetical protein